MNFQSKIVQESEFGTWPSHGAGVPRGGDGRAAAFDVSLHGLERLVPIGAHMEQQQHPPLTGKRATGHLTWSLLADHAMTHSPDEDLCLLA